MHTDTSIDWEDIRYVLAIASAGSLSKAGHALGVQHTTLSRRVMALERRLGVQLFHRARDGMSLLAPLDEILRLARVAEQNMLAVERRLVALGAGPRRVRLATSGILATGLLADHVDELLQQDPEICIELLVGRALVSLARREAELALRLRAPGAWVAEPSVVAPVIARVGWAAYAVRNGKARARVVFRGAVRPGDAWLRRHAKSFREIAVDDVPTAVALARAGVAIAVLPCFLAEREPALRRRSGILEEHRLVLAIPSELRRVADVARVIDWIKRVAKAERARLAGA